MSDPVRWGVLGCAAIAINHVIPGILQAEGATLTAVASRTLDKAVKVAKQFGAPKAYGSYEALLADPEVEAVYIPLPNGLHKAWSIAAMRAGKDVLCEKPITLNAAEAREIQAVRQETGRLTIEAFAYRFQPLIEKAIEIARSGRLGELQMLHTTMSFKLALNPADVRLQAAIGGGALYDVGCYALNLQRMLVGREPRMAWCKLTWSEQFGVDVSGAGVLDYGQGLLGTFRHRVHRHDECLSHGGYPGPAGRPLRHEGACGRGGPVAYRGRCDGEGDGPAGGRLYARGAGPQRSYPRHRAGSLCPRAA